MKEIGAMLGKSEAAISSWIKGVCVGRNRPMVAEFDKLTKIFDVSVYELMYGEDEKGLVKFQTVQQCKAQSRRL